MGKCEALKPFWRTREGDDRGVAAELPGNLRRKDDNLLDLLSMGHPPAFASDSRDRIVFWNRGAAELLGRRAEEVLGRHCYEVTLGRDVFGNRFCYANCPVAASIRAGDELRGFELGVSADGHGRRLLGVTILRIPSVREDLFTLLHILEPIEEGSRLLRELRRLGATFENPPTSNVPGNGHLQGAQPSQAAAPVVPTSLTRREREVLGWMAAGLQNKDVARTLGLSPSTVRNHVHNILDKLGVHSKLEAVCLAFRNEWVEGQPLAPSPRA